MSLDVRGRCKGHEWEWLRDDYTTAVYRCRHCGRERGVWKNRTTLFERENKVPVGRGRFSAKAHAQRSRRQ